jgi:serine/threonine protein kinase/predicted ATPase
MAHEETLLGSYRLLSPLGQGGMGTVWRAEHTQSLQQVALKTVKVPREELLRGIRREIQTLARLRHPGIVRILEEGLHEGVPYYTMELLQGVSLEHWRFQMRGSAETGEPAFDDTQPGLDLASQDTALVTEQTIVSRGPISPLDPASFRYLLGIIKKLCGPLAFLHGEGIVHRDLKPNNILIRPDDTPILVDFGIASLHQYDGEASREKVTLEDRLVGTLPYMSPEQLRGEALDARSDLYSLGVVLFELLTGRYPFELEEPALLLHAQLFEEAPRLSQFLPDIPAPLEQLVSRLLSKRRSERPGYAEDVARVFTEMGISGDLEGAPSPRVYLYRPMLSGRSSQLEILTSRVRGIEANGGGLVLLGGESGVGKTRLALELVRELQNNKLRVVVGECQDRGARFPLDAFRKPLLEIADLCRSRGLEETERLLGKRGKILSRYEPSLALLPGQAEQPEPEDLAPAAAKKRLFTYLAQTLDAYCNQSPLLLLLDDLQWADELSLEFLSALQKDQKLCRWMFILGTYRTEEINESLQKLLSSTENITLDRLGDDAVASMVGDMLALSPPPTLFSRYLSHHSEGNPFFVAEYLRSAVQEGILWRDSNGRWQVQDEAINQEDGARLPLPKTLRTLVERRLANLPARALSLLESLSVLGREAPLSLIERVHPLSERELEESIAELFRRQVLDDDTPGKLRFAHDKLRELSYARLSESSRKELHRRAAEQLGSLFGEDEQRQGELGYHWEQAGEPARARPCYLEGARRATRSYSHQEAERLYRAYLRLVEVHDEESLTVCFELGEKVLEMQGRMEEALELHRTSFEQFKRLGLRSRQAQSLRQMGLVYWRLGRLKEAREVYDESLAIARADNDLRAEGAALGGMGILYMERGQLEEAMTLFQKAIEIHRQSKHRRAEGTILINLAIIYFERGQAEESLRLFDEALVAFREVDDKRFEGVVLANSAFIQMQMNRPADAQRSFELALVLLREVGDKRAESINMGYLAMLHRDQGRMEESYQLLNRSLQLLRELNDRRYEGITLYELATLVRWRTGDLEECERLCIRGESLLKEMGDDLELGKLLCSFGHVKLAQEKSAAALIEQVNGIAKRSNVGAESDLGKRLASLQRSQQAFDSDDKARLFRGQLYEDIPEKVQQWLAAQPGA